MAVLPMFPLGSVLLPGAVLPLHVFEERYRVLVRDCLESADHEFGVVLIQRGSEVGGGDQRRDVGVVAKMLQVGQLDDGRYAVVALGTRRIRVNAWLPDDPYPLADVDDFADTDGDTDGDTIGDRPATEMAALITRLAQRVRRAAATASELGDAAPALDESISDDPLVASYHLAALAPVGAHDLYTLLAVPGLVERLHTLDRMLDDVDAIHRFRLADADQPSGWPP